MLVLRFPRLAAASLAFCAAATAQTGHKLTARELFYTPVTNVRPAAAATSKPAVSKPAPERSSPVVKRRSKTQAPDEGETVVKQRQSDPAVQPPLRTVAGLPPLALRYSLLKSSSDDSYREVDPESVFHSGDRIRVAVEANDAAYLYIVQQGSSKTWNVLFPNASTGNGDNRIEPNRQYVIPSGARFTFDDQPGIERLFLILSRQPEPSIESLIYSLSTGGAPARQETGAPQSKVLLAAARPIDDGVIARLRSQMVARDLVFEKVDESQPGPRKETAMYVATHDRTPGARIVVDLNLNHR